MDFIAPEATLGLALAPDFPLSGMNRGQPVPRRAASHPFERSVRRFLDAAGDHDPAAVACTPPDAAATLAVADAAERALRTSRAVRVSAPGPAPTAGRRSPGRAGRCRDRGPGTSAWTCRGDT